MVPLEAIAADPPQQPFLSNLRDTASAATEYGRSGPSGPVRAYPLLADRCLTGYSFEAAQLLTPNPSCR